MAGTAAATAIQSENASGVLSAEATGLGDAQEHENLPWPSSAAAREEESKATPPRTESEQEPEPLQANPEHCVEKPMEDRSSEKTPVAASPMPPSWAAQASSLFQMDSSMVLHGVSMALHSESEISPQGDALDFDVPPDVSVNASMERRRGRVVKLCSSCPRCTVEDASWQIGCPFPPAALSVC